MNKKVFIPTAISLAIALLAFVALADHNSVSTVVPSRIQKVERGNGGPDGSRKERADTKLTPKAVPSKTPKVERGNGNSEFGRAQKNKRHEEKEQREAQRKQCRLEFKNAKNTFELATRKAKLDFRIAEKKAELDWKASDKSDAAKNAFRVAKKLAQDNFAAAKKSAKDAWKAAVDAHNQCVRKNPNPSPRVSVPAATPVLTATPIPTVTPAPTQN